MEGDLYFKILNFYLKAVQFVKRPTRIQWGRPEKCDILIFDAMGSEYLKHIIDQKKYKTSTLETRLESINIFCLLDSFTNGKFWHVGIFKSYLNSYIKICSPRIVITFIDNNRHVYEISKFFPKIKILVIQNGRRGKTNDLFSFNYSVESWKADYVFIFGPLVKEIYSKYINANFVVIGSLRNNMAGRSSPDKQETTKVIAYISNWRPKTSRDNFYANATYEQFYFAEEILLKYLSEWVRVNHYELKVVGSSENFTDQEEQFFVDKIGHSDFYFSPRKGLSSYETIDNSHVVVSIDSTLGLESLARGNRTAIFPYRGYFLGWDDWLFGWPGEYSDRGPFWSNKPIEQDFQRVMDLVSGCSNDAFREISSSVTNELIHYDPHNTIIKSTISQIMAD